VSPRVPYRVIDESRPSGLPRVSFVDVLESPGDPDCSIDQHNKTQLISGHIWRGKGCPVSATRRVGAPSSARMTTISAPPAVGPRLGSLVPGASLPGPFRSVLSVSAECKGLVILIPCDPDRGAS